MKPISCTLPVLLHYPLSLDLRNNAIDPERIYSLIVLWKFESDILPCQLLVDGAVGVQLKIHVECDANHSPRPPRSNGTMNEHGQ